MITTQQATKKAVAALNRIGQAFIKNPGRWTRYAAARNKNGKAINSRSGHAVQFCAIGALCNGVRDSRVNHIATGALRYVLPAHYGKDGSIVQWNDNQSRATTVGRKFLKAAKALANGDIQFD